MRIILFILLFLAGAAIAVYAAGSRMEPGHTARRSLHLRAAPHKVFAVLADFGGQAAWRSDLKSVRRKADSSDEVWIEEGKQGEMPLATTEIIPESKIVRTIADPKLPFGGKWTYQVVPEGSGSALIITEEGEVYNPFFRFVFKRFMDPHKTIEVFMHDLAKHLGEEGRID